jgi:hypothetical protein
MRSSCWAISMKEKLGADIHGFARMSAKWNLVDVLQNFHGVINKPPTYARSTWCLKCIFCTANLLVSVKKCGILPYSKKLSSQTIEHYTLILTPNHWWEATWQASWQLQCGYYEHAALRQAKSMSNLLQVYGRTSCTPRLGGNKCIKGAQWSKNWCHW